MENAKIKVSKLSINYDNVQAVRNVSMLIKPNTITAFIGPSGCGKSSFLRCFNRMNDDISSCLITGSIIIDGFDIYNNNISVEVLRSRVGMVFQKANPFPKSIYENVAYGIRIHSLAKDKSEMDKMVEENLKKVGLWEEVKDRLNIKGTELSGGQQQRLCIARAIAIEPEVVLMDEPCSALDPIATAKIEELISSLSSKYTIIIVTHSMSQAQRISDKTAFFHMGELVEYGNTKDVFNNPIEKRTLQYIKGEFG